MEKSFHFFATQIKSIKPENIFLGIEYQIGSSEQWALRWVKNENQKNKRNKTFCYIWIGRKGSEFEGVRGTTLWSDKT